MCILFECFFHTDRIDILLLSCLRVRSRINWVRWSCFRRDRFLSYRFAGHSGLLIIGLAVRKFIVGASILLTAIWVRVLGDLSFWASSQTMRLNTRGQHDDQSREHIVGAMPKTRVMARLPNLADVLFPTSPPFALVYDLLGLCTHRGPVTTFRPPTLRLHLKIVTIPGIDNGVPV